MYLCIIRNEKDKMKSGHPSPKNELAGVSETRPQFHRISSSIPNLGEIPPTINIYPIFFPNLSIESTTAIVKLIRRLMAIEESWP